MTIPCVAQDIIGLNNTKEYTLTCTQMLQAVLTDQQLNAQASKLWQILFNKAKFKEELDVKISYSELADLMQKSMRTIQRYVANLANSGYLVIKNNYFNSGGQTVNTIYVRFPRETISTIKKTKNRVSAKKIISKNTNITVEQTISQHDKIVTGGGDKFVTPKNNINNKNTNNKEFVVYSFSSVDNSKQEEQNQEIENQIQKIETDFKKLGELCKTAEQEIGSAKGKNEQIKKHYQFLSICSQKDSLAITLETLKEKLKKNCEKASFQTEFNSNPVFAINQTGNRIVNEFTFKRLERELEKLGYQFENKIRLLNEIIFEVRFGSLVKNNITKQEMPIERAINVALKLVREKRWNTPTILAKKFI